MNVNEITETLKQLNDFLPEYKGTLNLKIFKDGSSGIHSGSSLIRDGFMLPDWLYHCRSGSIEECINSIKEYLKENN